MKLLAIETSTEACSAALICGEEILQRHEVIPRQHARRILTLLDELLNEAGFTPSSLDGLAFGRGPGSFTGVRIAAAAVQGIALARDLPVAPVSSLATLAQGCFRIAGKDLRSAVPPRESSRPVLAAIDARMREIYWGAYECNSRGLAYPIQADSLCSPERIAISSAGGRDWYGVGSAWAVYGEIMAAALSGAHMIRAEPIYPMAQDLARLGVAIHEAGLAVDAAAALPSYLRDQVTY